MTRDRKSKSKAKGITKFAGRIKKQRLKTAKGRKLSSSRWLQRQLSDPYVVEARRRGYRSRAAFKLLELNDRFEFLKPGHRVVDLGAAPGGWTQVAVEIIGNKGKGCVVALDIAEMEPIAGATVLHCDFMDMEAPDLLKKALNGPADVVLSDMAPAVTGHGATDHIRIVAFCEAAFEFACEVLTPGGVFIAKVFQGGTEQELLARMKLAFSTVRHAKPPASRAESSETYVIATGYRGTK